MPNHCHNRVTFYSDNKEKEIKKLYDIFSIDVQAEDEERTIFGQFIPEPDWTKVPLTAETQQEYSFSKPRGEIGECPKLIINEEKPFLSGHRFPSTGELDDRWYNWRVQNWGTKWDCYDLSTDDCDLPNGFEASFNTAWSPPEEICTAIREQFEGISVSWFYDEPGCEVAGYL